MSGKSLSSKINAAAISIALVAGSAVTTEEALAEGRSAANTDSNTIMQADQLQEIERRKFETWSVQAPKQARFFKDKAQSLAPETPFAPWMRPKAFFNSPDGGAISYTQVLIENERAMRGGKMLSAVVVIVPPGSSEIAINASASADPGSWFKTSEEGKRVLQVQKEAAFAVANTVKKHGGIVDRVYMVEHPLDQDLNIVGRQYSPKNAVIILMGDKAPVIEYDPKDVGTTLFTMFSMDRHITVPQWYAAPHNADQTYFGNTNEDKSSGSQGAAGGHAGQAEVPDFVSPG